MSDIEEYRCFIGGLSWSTTDGNLKDAFEKFGHLTEAKLTKGRGYALIRSIFIDGAPTCLSELADSYSLLFSVLIHVLVPRLPTVSQKYQVVVDRFSGRSRGFGFVTFDEKNAMEEAIEAMNGIDLDGRAITVDRAQPQGSSRDRNGDRDYDRYRGRGRDRDHGRDFGGGRGSNSGECFKCGKPGHFARECPSGDGARGDRYGGRDDRYGSGGSGNSRYGPDRNGDRYSGRNRDGGSRSGPGTDRYNRDRSGPYERPSGGGYRS